MQIKGVYGLHEPHFWTLCTDYYVGTLRIQLDLLISSSRHAG